MTDFDDELDEALSEQPHPLLTGLRTGDWLDAQVFPPLSYVVPGLIPEGLSLLVGAPKIGKSWLSLAVALAAASGGCALGNVKVGPPRPVLLLALEDGDRRLQDRIRKLIPGESIPPLLNYMTRITAGMVVATIEAWLATIDQPLAILDTLGKVMPPAMNGETAYQRDYKVAGRLKEICDNRPGMALTGLHHDRKAATEDFVESVSGTNGIAGAADTIILISRPRNETQGLLKVTGRDVVEGEYAVTIEDGIWQLMGDTLNESAEAAVTLRATANLGDRQAEILRFVNKHSKGVRAADVADAVDVSEHEARTYLGRLFNADKVRKPERGLYTPVATVATVAFDEATQPESNTRNTRNTTSKDCTACTAN
jgi:RecA-family ATPase